MFNFIWYYIGCNLLLTLFHGYEWVKQRVNNIFICIVNWIRHFTYLQTCKILIPLIIRFLRIFQWWLMKLNCKNQNSLILNSVYIFIMWDITFRYPGCAGELDESSNWFVQHKAHQACAMYADWVLSEVYYVWCQLCQKTAHLIQSRKGRYGLNILLC